MKKVLFWFCLLLNPCWLFAQNINVDSLIRVAISRAGNSGIAAVHNRDSLFKAFTLTKQSAERTQLIYKMINYGQPTSKIGLTYHYKILNWARKNNDQVSEAIISAEIAFQLAINGDVAEAIKMDLNALNLAKATGNNEAIGIVYDSMGCCFAIGDNNPSAAKLKAVAGYFQQGLKYSTAAHNDIFISYDLGGLGAVYHALNKPDSARFYGLKSFEHSVLKNINIQISQSLLDLQKLQTDDKLKLKFAWAAATIAGKARDTVKLSYACVALAQFYKEKHQPDSAMFYAKKAYNLSRNKSYNDQIAPASLLIKLYTGINADSTLKYTNIYYTTKDSLYNISKAERAQAATFAEQQHQQELAATELKYKTQVRISLLIAALIIVLAVGLLLWRNSIRSKKANTILQSQKEQLQQTLQELKQTQRQLIQSEKMASLGELTAGIAHEIQNPLNFVNNFSDVNVELIEELQQEIATGNMEEIKALAADIQENEKKINMHGKRADGIVKGMLQHSKAGTGVKEPADINALADEFLKLSYHGLRAKDSNFNAALITNFDKALPKVKVSPQDIGRVFLNLFNNAFYAVNEQQKTADDTYKPEVAVSTSITDNLLKITVKDNGTGIPDAIKDKILQPFFTTKPTGQGTGLGLSLSYDIVVKGHGGTIQINSAAGEGAEFIITLPV